jgi:hypothetical protein
MPTSSGDRPDVDDRPAAAGGHQRDGVLAGEESAASVDVEDVVPDLDRGVGRGGRGADAGHVGEARQPSPRGRLFDYPPHRGLVAHVALRGADQLPSFGRGGLRGLGPDVHGDDPGAALGGQAVDGGPADAGPRARDHDQRKLSWLVTSTGTRRNSARPSASTR